MKNVAIAEIIYGFNSSNSLKSLNIVQFFLLKYLYNYLILIKTYLFCNEDVIHMPCDH